MRVNSPFGADNPHNEENEPAQPAPKLTPENIKSLRNVLDMLYAGMEQHNNGKQFDKREKAMIGHAFFVGAAAIVKLTTYDAADGPPTEEEMQVLGALLMQYKKEVDAYMKWTHDRTNELN